MARIVYSALVSSINGSIAGTTFQRNAYGHTIKKKPNIVNPNRKAQQPRRAALQLISQTWQSLTGAERAQWQAQAIAFPVPSRLNPSASLTGHALWLRLNLMVRMMNLSIRTSVASTPQDVLNVGTIEVNRVGATLIYFNDSDSTLSQLNTLCFVSAPIKVTQLYDRSRTRFMGYFALPSVDQVDITTAYIAQFGALPNTGDNIFLKVVYVNLNNGQMIFYPPQNIVVG